MKKLFTVVVTLLLTLSLLTNPIAQACEEDVHPVPTVTESEPDDGVMPAKHPPVIEIEDEEV